MTAAVAAERSQAAFAARFPALMERLADTDGGAASLVVEDGTAIDIMVGERRIYGGDARRFAADQVKGFMAKPLRLFMDQPSAAGLVSEICNRMVAAIKAELDQRHMAEIQRHPTGNPTFLIVFGLGLGHHLLDLARQSKARWLILVEPSPEFIKHSFHSLDWAALIDHFDAGQGEIHLITETDPGEMVAEIVRHVAKHGIPYIDGAWVFTHYPLWSFAEARTQLHEAMQFAFVNRGFFEDELKMMTNAVTNFANAPFWLIEGKPRLHRPETAVIVGAGPSLDESIETLHDIRDRIVLFSSGTALRPLLRNGLVPDFHCEIENVPEVVDVLQRASAYGDLSQIKLIASATVDPRVPPMFAESFFFFRDSVSSTLLLGSKFHVLSGAAPTCVNTSMAAALSLGFTDFILVGTDCGIRPGGHHHASDTVYRDVGLYKETADRKARYPIEVEGNFGGIALTDWIYDACRRMLAEAIRVFALSVVNCSDGALIPGARPMVLDAVEIAGPPVDREKFIADLKRSFRRFGAAEILGDTDFPAMIEQTKEFYREIGDILNRFEAKDADFGQVYQAIREFLADADRRHANVDAMSNGTIFALPRIGMFYGYRVAEGELRETLFSLFMSETRAILQEMEEKTLELFGALAKKIEDAEPYAISRAEAPAA